MKKSNLSLTSASAGIQPNPAIETATAPPLSAAPTIGAPPNPFDPARLRLSASALTMGQAKKQLTVVPVRKPSKEQFVRVHPDEAYRIQTYVLELKDDREIYLIDPSLWDELQGESTVSPRLLVTTQTRQGVVFLWPVRLPGPDGRIDDWNRSAMDAVDMARDSWVRVQANMSLGAYDVFKASGIRDEPVWEVPDFSEILKVAFRDKFIQDLDHLVIRRLRVGV